MAESAIVLQNVSKSFGDVNALESVSFDLNRASSSLCLDLVVAEKAPLSDSLQDSTRAIPGEK